MKPKKKNAFMTFIFSFMPGAAELYMGFNKSGFSLLAIFMIFACVMAGGISDIFMGFVAIIYIVSFFHARSVASMDAEEFATFEDRYIWEEYLGEGSVKFTDKKVRTWGAVLLIIFGTSILWGYIKDIFCRIIPDSMWGDLYPIVDGLPQIVIAVILIVIGVLLIKGKKKEIDSIEEVDDGNNQNA
ncbi:hypothetical protein [Butyrivibrio hungatei]|uniref:TM2 domain-containing protein n=1 Tax=Butyrivibrio hungatei TaxID=185008 RepID=A0A1D9P4R0_9FIRM|nr:hypothetical protein [Butyrivibrio hungatei]AOZ97596.1 hypothetical protein bhn_I2564 [Butyrivibrio hungatei]